jgi:hypothetical protein
MAAPNHHWTVTMNSNPLQLVSYAMREELLQVMLTRKIIILIYLKFFEANKAIKTATGPTYTHYNGMYKTLTTAQIMYEIL